MPAESPRIAELRRRIEADPASIAFAQLAEEYRRAGNFEAAEECCRSGLIRHPGYLSARVTLGRTLIELGRLDQAEQELQLVLNSAPDNLAAIRGMAEIHQRRGHLESALEYYRRALPLARHDPDLEETVSQIKRELGAVRPAPNAAMLSFAEAQNELLSAASRMPDARRPEAPPPPAPPSSPASARKEPDASHGAASSASSPSIARQSETSYGAVAPKRPSAAEADAASPAAASPSLSSQTDSIDISSPFEPEVSIDFDSLLKSLGAADYTAPPMVEALLTEPAPPAPRPEPVLPELPIEKPSADAHAALRRGLQEFDRPGASGATGATGSVRSSGATGAAGAPTEGHEWLNPRLGDTSPAPLPEHGTASVAPQHRTEPVAPEAPVNRTEPVASASARPESQASSGETAPKRPEIESREGGPSAPVAAAAPELRAPAAPEHRTEPVAPIAPDAPASAPTEPEASYPPSLAQPSNASFGEAGGAASPAAPEISKEQVILDELEAWLAAIKR